MAQELTTNRAKSWRARAMCAASPLLALRAPNGTFSLGRARVSRPRTRTTEGLQTGPIGYVGYRNHTISPSTTATSVVAMRSVRRENRLRHETNEAVANAADNNTGAKYGNANMRPLGQRPQVPPSVRSTSLLRSFHPVGIVSGASGRRVGQGDKCMAPLFEVKQCDMPLLYVR